MAAVPKLTVLPAETPAAQPQEHPDLWAMDPKSPEFAAEARRQSHILSESPQEKDDMAFIKSVTYWPTDDE